MAVTLINNAIQDYQAGDSRRMFTLSNGNAMAIVVENKRTIKVFETSAADRKTGWTLRATISDPDGINNTLGNYIWGVTGALHANNDLSIVFTGAKWPGSGAVNIKAYHIKLTYSGYTVGSLENFFTADNSVYMMTGPGGLDADVSDTGQVHVALVYSTGQLQPTVRTWVRSSGGTWLQWMDRILASNPFNATSPGDYICSIVTLGGVTTAKRVVVAVNIDFYVGGTYQFSDVGTSIITATVNESTGALVSADTVRYTTTAAGTAYPTAQRNHKVIKLFRSAIHADLYILGIVVGTSYVPTADNLNSVESPLSNRAAYHKGAWDGTTWTNINPAQSWTFSNPNAALGTVGVPNRNFLGISFYDGNTDESSLAFYMVGAVVAGGVTYTRVGIMHAVFSPQYTGNVNWSNPGAWVDGATTDETNVYSGGNRNLGAAKHDIMILKSDNKPYHWQPPTPPAPTAVSPDNGQNVTTATPDLSVVAAFTEAYWAPAWYTAEWQIAPDNTFTTGVRTYNHQQIYGLVNFDGSITTPKTIVLDTDPGYAPLTAGSWYIRARLRGSDGVYSPYTTTTRLFTLGHPPTAVPIAPLNNQKFEYGFGTKTFSWNFTDPSTTDTQTAYQLRIRTSDATGTVVYDSGKVVSTVKSATAAIPVGNKNQVLYWEVRLWDTDDAAGIYSTGNTYFQMVDPATATITSPTTNQVLSSGTPTFSATVAATGGRVIKQYNYTVYRSGVAIWTSPTVYGNFANGVALTATVPTNVLNNSTYYSVTISVVDDAGVNSVSNSVPFSTSWTAALSATVFSASGALYNTEGSGYVTLTWTDANREAGFVAWRVYRSIDIIDPISGIALEFGEYTLWKEHHGAQAGTYTLLDYLAPSNQKVNYLIKQLVDRGGFYVESSNTTPASIVPVSDSYWLIDTTIPEMPEAFKLGFTTADDFTDETEEAEYVVIGRGRHVDKGDYLGPKGSLTIQLRDSVTLTTIVPTFNGTFETDVTGWSAANTTTFARDTAVKHSGAASLKMTDSASADVNAVISAPLTAYPGRVHTVIMWLSAYGNAEMQIHWYDAFGGFIRTDLTSTFSGGSTNFTQLTLALNAPLDAATFRIQANSVSTPPGGVTYLDDVSVSIASAVGNTARRKRLILLDYQTRNAPLYLRNPFGDVFKVNVSSMQVGRLAGVGTNEFVDVQIPYSQVG